MRRILTVTTAFLALCGFTPALGQQQYDPGGKARVSNYCKTTTNGDTPCPTSGNIGTVTTVTTVGTITNPVGVKGADGSAISSVSNPQPVEGSFASGSTTSGQTGILNMMATTTSPPTDTNAQTNPFRGDTHGAQRVVTQDTNGTVADYTSATLVVQTQQKPNGAIQSGASASGAAGIQTATMASQSGKTNYVCQVTFTASGATSGLAVAPTITGLLGGTRTFAFVFPAGVLVQAYPLVLNFSPCLPASAVTTAISAILPSGGSGNTQASADIEGYYQ